MVAVVTTRSRDAHDVRRRIWDQALGSKAIEKHQTKIAFHAHLLERRVTEEAGQVINITELFERFGFDVMGDIHYDRRFRLLETDDNDHVLDMFKAGTVTLGTLTPLPWMIQLLNSLPITGKGFASYANWAYGTVVNRIVNEPHEQDTMSWLLKAPVSSDYLNWLLGDFLTLTTGGTKPVVSALTFLFYHLAKSPEHVSQIRNEQGEAAASSGVDQRKRMQHLDALIFETLRLHPSIPSGGLRMVPRHGLQIGEVHVPGGATVVTPQYSLHRREDCFEHADEFIPERWTTRPEMVRNRTAFLPWGI
ncbi:MAG: hypothetical protein M1822_009934, partial [Bathelium mastoideum]